MSKKQIKPRTAFSLLEGDVVKKLSGLRDNHYDLIITSPPYNIGKVYERGSKLDLQGYVKWLNSVIDLLVKKLKDTGSICWQVGNYVNDGEVFPLDIFFYSAFKKHNMQLRNRIVWHFNFGLHSTKRLSGRYETILWFTKTEKYKFNSDAIRVPQLYPGKRHSEKKKGRAGKLSGNPLGKNATDFWIFSAEQHFAESSVWELPNVKANHPEKTIHPCQFPLELAERCVLAFTDANDLVLDPFVGAGINLFLSAAKASVPQERWTSDKKEKKKMLTTTIINGLVICLRKIIEADSPHDFEFYRKKFGNDLVNFQFGTYKSSQYVRMGQGLYDKFFAG